MAEMSEKGIVSSPGMDDPQAQSDRMGWTIPSGMPTGNSDRMDAMMGGGPVVGNQYDTDPLGEEYGAVTYPSGGGSASYDHAPTAKK